ncbi:MAG: hypothetical protein ACXWIN_11530 [Burkholderiaceae bacterium]
MATFSSGLEQMPTFQGMNEADISRQQQQKMLQTTQEQIKQANMAAEFGMQLDKMKMFHTMAKQINDQQ